MIDLMSLEKLRWLSSLSLFCCRFSTLFSFTSAFLLQDHNCRHVSRLCVLIHLWLWLQVWPGKMTRPSRFCPVSYPDSGGFPTGRSRKGRSTAAAPGHIYKPILCWRKIITYLIILNLWSWNHSRIKKEISFRIRFFFFNECLDIILHNTAGTAVCWVLGPEG